MGGRAGRARRRRRGAARPGRPQRPASRRGAGVHGAANGRPPHVRTSSLVLDHGFISGAARLAVTTVRSERHARQRCSPLAAVSLLNPFDESDQSCCTERFRCSARAAESSVFAAEEHWWGARRDEDPAEELETRRQRLVPILEHTVGEPGSSPAEARRVCYL